MSSGIENISAIHGKKKLSSGLEGLDFQLEGGIPSGSLILLCGGPLSGIEKLSVQFWEADKSGQSSYFMMDSPVSEGMVDAVKYRPDEILGEMSGKWIVLDSLSTLLINSSIDEIIKFLRISSQKVKEEGGNMLLVMYSGICPDYEEVIIKRNCDTIFTLTIESQGSEIERYLQVNKINGMDVPKRVFPYNILEKGIELSTTGRVV